MTPEMLAVAAIKYRRAQDDLDASRDLLAQAVRDAIADGMSQSEAARIVGVDRLTIRKWLSEEGGRHETLHSSCPAGEGLHHLRPTAARERRGRVAWPRARPAG